MVAGLLERHGVSLGEMLKPTQYNVRGSFESLGVKREMKAVLEENGVAPTDRGHLAIPRGKWIDAFTSRVNWKTRVELAWDGAENGLWAVKETRILNTWPLWRDAYPDALYVLPRRLVDDNVASMLKHPHVSRNGDAEILRWWVLMCFKRQEQIAASCPHIFVDTDKMVAGDLGESRRLVERCGLVFDEAIAKEWIWPDLWTV
jgi:hypothetical protein